MGGGYKIPSDQGPVRTRPARACSAAFLRGFGVGIQFRQEFEIELEDGVNSVVQCYRKISQDMKKQQPNLGPLSPQAPASPFAPGSPHAPQASTSNAGVRRFVDYFGNSGGLSLYRPKDVTVYVASLNGSFLQGVTEGLGEAGVEAQAVSLTQDRAQLFWDRSHNEKALVDILTVALSSEVLIVTPRSTFGYTIVGFSSAPAYSYDPVRTGHAGALLPPTPE